MYIYINKFYIILVITQAAYLGSLLTLKESAWGTFPTLNTKILYLVYYIHYNRHIHYYQVF